VQSHIKVKNNIEINLAESSSSGVAAGAQDLIRQSANNQMQLYGMFNIISYYAQNQQWFI
jgi:hypothetical protein